MSIQTYVPVDNLPAPITTGTTIQNFTDVWGDVWVAKNGVNGGNWRRARDVLTSKIYRAAAWTTGSSGSLLSFDSVTRDPYGLAGGGQWTCPVAGVYAVSAVAGITFTATAQAAYININDSIVGNVMLAGQHSSMGYGAGLTVSGAIFFGAGIVVGIFTNTSGPTLNGQAGAGITSGTFAYLGTG
jgi:hypothetical protein